MVIPLNRLLEVWEGVVTDSHYEFFIGRGLKTSNQPAGIVFASNGEYTIYVGSS